jgi:C-terminal processing protease CtpA/Prc
MYEIHLMAATTFRRRADLAIAAAALTAAIACPGCVDRWQGTVDAGFRYRTADKQTVVREIPPGSFAERAGLAPNDVVIAVDGVSVTNASAQEVLAAMHGPTGTIARLTILREGTVVEIAIERTPLAEKTETKEAAPASE